MRYSTLIATLLLTSFAWSGAIAVEKPPPASYPIEQGPFHDPRTGSYFELRISKGIKPNWHSTRALAAKLSYKGRPGRLAIVKDQETLDFIREHFRFNEEAWIGLQFFCKFRKLMWVTGELQPLNTPGMWAPQWYRNQNMHCSAQNWPYMPVYLTSERAGPVIYWQATSPEKYWKSYVIEYPAPPAEAKDSGQAAK